MAYCEMKEKQKNEFMEVMECHWKHQSILMNDKTILKQKLNKWHKQYSFEQKMQA